MTQNQIPEELYWWIESANDDSLSDSTFFTVLEDTVKFYNQEHNTHFDPNSTVLAWLEWHNKQGLNK